MWHDTSELPPAYETCLVRTPDNYIGYAFAYHDGEAWKIPSSIAIGDMYGYDEITVISVTEWMDSASFQMMMRETR